jgi:hypothetical protein
MFYDTVVIFFELILILIPCNIISFVLLKLITCTYKVCIRNIQYSLLHVLAVDRHLQGATPKRV